MGAMMKQIHNLAFYGGWGVIGLSLFLMVFAGVVLWVFRKGSKETYQQIQNLPFEDERISV
jgi:cbb3-type cytochrome oxidase subunit 3